MIDKLVFVLLASVQIFCLAGALFGYWGLEGWVKTVYLELKPFWLPCILYRIAATALHGGMLKGLAPLWYAIDLFTWWYWRNQGDDDDRWKRRRRKVLEKISQVGGQLKVVPAK